MVTGVSREELSSITKVCLSGLLGIRLLVVVQTVEAVGPVHFFPSVILAWVLENVHTHALPGTVQ